MLVDAGYNEGEEVKSGSIGEGSENGNISEIVNTQKEKDERIIELADEEEATLIAFIAPYISVRVSPVEKHRATISIPDEFGVEALIKNLREADTDKAYLLVNTLGGGMSSAYKIARVIRKTFDQITTFVPHIAASGGTLLALTGDKIVMGPMSHLTPLDVQISYKDTSISAHASMRFLTRASEWFEKLQPGEAPYPYKALTDKLDPFILEEWDGAVGMAIEYASEILDMAGYDDSKKLAEFLVEHFPNHQYVITPDEATKIGLEVERSEVRGKLWSCMRYWLGNYVFKEETSHYVRYALPEDYEGEGAQKPSEKEESNGGEN